MKRFLLTGSLLLIVVLLGAAAVPANDALAKNGPELCAIQTYNGHYLTAVGGGGRTTDTIHTNATQVGNWEKLVLVDLDLGTPVITYGIETYNHHYLTAVGGGGRISDVIHTNATQPQAWEQFVLESLGGGWYDIKTVDGHYLTATGGGGHGIEVPETMHSDATKVDTWEKFKVICYGPATARTVPTGSPKLAPGGLKLNQGATLNQAGTATPASTLTPGLLKVNPGGILKKKP